MYTPLNIGSTPNDNTGTPLRTAGEMLNAMLLELYTDLALKTPLTEFTTYQSTIASLLSTMDAAILERALTADLLGKAEANEVVNTVETQALTDVQRLKHANNSGSLVTLAFRIFDDTQDIVAGTWRLPRLPANFLVHSVIGTVDDAGGAVMSATLKTGTNDPIASLVSKAFGTTTTGAHCEFTLDATNILAMNSLVLNISSFVPNYGDPDTEGFTLWIRGLWK